MAEQLLLSIQVQGGQEALSLLSQIDARLQAMPATAQRAGAGQQSAAQATGAAWQQAATLTAAGWDRSAAQMEARQDRASAAIAAAANRAADAQDRAAVRASQSALREFDRQIAAADQLAAKQAALAAHGDVILGAGLTAGAVALTGALEQSVQEAAKFQRTFTDVDVVLRPTAEGMAQLQQRAIDLGASTQFSSQQIATGFYELASAGLNEREVLAAIEPAIQAATLGHQQLGQTTLTVASVMRQFGLSAEDVPKIIDVQTVAVRNSLLHWGELDEAYRNVQGSAKFMGISLEETTAALEIQRNAGTSATQAGTSFRTFLDRISKQEGEAGSAIREMNLHIYNQGGAFVGLIPLMQQIEAATAGLTEADRNRVIAQLAGGRASSFLKDTLVQTKEVEIEGQTVTLRGVEVLKYLADANYASRGAAAAANAEIAKTLAFNWQTFTSSVQEAAIRLGGQFVPAATAAAETARDLTNQFIHAPVATQQMAAAFTGIGAAALGAGGLVAGTAGAFALMGTSVAAAAVTLAPFAIGIGAVAAASAVLAAAWINDWGNIRETTADVAAHVQTDLAGIGAVLNGLGTAAHAATTEVGSLFTALSQTPAGTALGGLFSGLGAQAEAAGLNWGAVFKANIALALGPTALALPALDQWLHGQGAAAQATAAEEGKRVGDDFVANVVQAIIATAGTQGSAVGQAAAQLRAEFVGRGFSEDEAAVQVQAYMDRVVAALNARRADMAGAGQQTGAAFTDGAVAGLAPLPERVAAILENVKKTSKQTGETTGYDYAAGILDALRAGDAAAAQSILELERATAFYAQTLRTLTPAQAVHAEQLRLAGNEQSALDQLVAEGTVKLADYQEAVMGTAHAHEKAQSALQQHTAAVQAWLGSTNPAIVAAGQWAQAVDSYASKLAQANPAIAANVLAARNQGDTEQTLTAIMRAENVTRDEAIGRIQQETGARQQHGQAVKAEATTYEEWLGLLGQQREDKLFQSIITQAPLAVQAQLQVTRVTQGVSAALQEAGKLGGFGLDTLAVAFGDDAKAAEAAVARIKAAITGLGAGAAATSGGSRISFGGPTAPATTTPTAGAASSTSGTAAAITAPFEMAAARVDVLGAQITARLATAATAVTTQAEAVGAATDAGIATGLDAGGPAIDTAITGVVTDAITTAQATLGIASPSAVAAAQVGAPISQGVADGITAESPGIAAAAQEAAATIGPAMAAQIRDDWPQVQAALHAISDYAASLGPAFADGARHAAAEVAPALQDGLSYAEIQTAVATLGDETARGLIAAMNAASGPARDAARAELRQAVADQQAATDAAAAEAASSAATAAQDALRDGFAVLRASLDEAQGTAGTAGTATGANYVEAVAARVEAGQPVLSQTVQAAVASDANGPAAAAAGQEVGNALIQGIVQGITDRAPAVGEAVIGAGQAALDAAKHFFGIASPSRIMADQVGAPLMDGLAEGITAASDKPIAAMSAEATQIVLLMQQAARAQIALPGNHAFEEWTKALDGSVQGLGLARDGADKTAERFKSLDSAADSLVTTVDKATVPVEKLKMAVTDLGDGLDSMGPSTPDFVEDVAHQLQQLPVDAGLAVTQLDALDLPGHLAAALTPPPDTQHLGAAFIDGITTGVEASAPGLRSAVLDGIDGTLDAARAQYGIASPSAVFAADLGAPMSEGVATGITAGAPAIATALDQALTAPLDQALTMVQGVADRTRTTLDAFGRKAEAGSQLALAYKSTLSATDAVMQGFNNTQRAEVEQLKKAGDAYGALTTAIDLAGVGGQNLTGIINGEREATERLNASLQANVEHQKHMNDAMTEAAAGANRPANVTFANGALTLQEQRANEAQQANTRPGAGAAIDVGAQMAQAENAAYERALAQGLSPLEAGRQATAETQGSSGAQSAFNESVAQRNLGYEQMATYQAAEARKQQEIGAAALKQPSAPAAPAPAGPARAVATGQFTAGTGTTQHAVPVEIGYDPTAPGAKENAEAAVRHLVDEATHRWASVAAQAAALQKGELVSAFGNIAATALGPAPELYSSLTSRVNEAENALKAYHTLNQRIGATGIYDPFGVYGGGAAEGATALALSPGPNAGGGAGAGGGDTTQMLNITVQGNTFQQADVGYITAAADAAQAAWDVRK